MNMENRCKSCNKLIESEKDKMTFESVGFWCFQLCLSCSNDLAEKEDKKEGEKGKFLY